MIFSYYSIIISLHSFPLPICDCATTISEYLFQRLNFFDFFLTRQIENPGKVFERDYFHYNRKNNKIITILIKEKNQRFYIQDNTSFSYFNS